MDRQKFQAAKTAAERRQHLNESIGGYDQDANYVANRVAGDLGAIVRAQ